MADWVIAATFALPNPPLEKHIDMLSDRFDELDWSVTQEPDARVTIVGDSEGESTEIAVQYVLHIAREALRDVGLPTETVRIDISTEEERERQALRPSLPELVSATEAGQLLGVSRQRVHQLARDSDDFPEPVLRTAAGPLWAADAIRWFEQQWTRRPGRPSRRQAEPTTENVTLLRPLSKNIEPNGWDSPAEA